MYYMCRQMKCWGVTEWNVSQKLKLKTETEVQMAHRSALKHLVSIWKTCVESENWNWLTVGKYCDCE